MEYSFGEALNQVRKQKKEAEVWEKVEAALQTAMAAEEAAKGAEKRKAEVEAEAAAKVLEMNQAMLRQDRELAQKSAELAGLQRAVAEATTGRDAAKAAVEKERQDHYAAMEKKYFTQHQERLKELMAERDGVAAQITEKQEALRKITDTLTEIRKQTQG